MADHRYRLQIDVQTDRALTDDEQRQLGDANDDFESVIGGLLSEVDGLRVFAVEASGPDEVQS